MFGGSSFAEVPFAALTTAGSATSATDSDAGTGAESVAVVAVLVLVDTGTGLEAVSLGGTVIGSESGGSVEAVGLVGQLATAEVGSESSSSATSAQLASADSGTDSESGGDSGVTSPDGGTCGESATLAALMVVVESAGAGEFPGLVGLSGAAEAGTGDDAPVVIRGVLVAGETGSGGESPGGTPARPLRRYAVAGRAAARFAVEGQASRRYAVAGRAAARFTVTGYAGADDGSDG